MQLTDVKVRAAAATEKPVRLADGEGLYLEVRPTGGKWWRFRYLFEGREKMISLDTYPTVSLKAARKARDVARELLDQGVDPSADRKKTKEKKRQATLTTFEPVARAWLKHRASAWTAGTLDAITASLENHVLPALGKMAIADIGPRDIKLVVQAVDKAGAGETAGRVFQRLRAMYRYALSEELIETDPTYSLKPAEMFRPRDVAHRRALGEADMPEFLRRLDDYGGDPSTRAALLLLVLTATRPGELRGMRWAELDEMKALWRIPAERMKMSTEHLVPMSKQALAVLEQMRPLSGDDALVFPSPFYPGKPLSDGTLNSALAKMGYKGQATAHGFRTLFSTCANEAGWKGDLVEKQLAHEERDETRAAYNRAQYLADRVKLMEWWGGEVDKMRAAQCR